jgi:hypothetical protein
MKLLESENGEDNDCAETFWQTQLKSTSCSHIKKIVENQAGHSQIILRKTYDKNCNWRVLTLIMTQSSMIDLVIKHSSYNFKTL